MKKLHCGDKVIVNSGKCKGQIGIIKKINNTKVYIDGINNVKKHIKADYKLKKPGYIVQKESYIHISNISILNFITNKKDKIGIRTVKNSFEKIRYFKSNGITINENL